MSIRHSCGKSFSIGCGIVVILSLVLLSPDDTGATSNENASNQPAARKPAPPYNGLGPSALAASLDTNLRASALGTYAGTAIADDGSIEVYATTADATVANVISKIQGSTNNKTPVKIIPGSKNTLASLEQVRDTITTRLGELHGRGIAVQQWGPDVRKNRIIIEVEGLTLQAKASLEQEFGADKIEVVEQKGWHTAGTRFVDNPPWSGGIRLNGPATCTSGFNVLKHNGFGFDTEYVTTAGHYGYGSWNNAGQYIGDTYQIENRNNGDTDAQLINADMTQGYVYVNALDLRHVASYSVGQQPGETGICVDGSFTGEVCGARILLTGQCIFFQDEQITTCGLITAQAPSGQPVVGEIAAGRCIIT